jgi:L-lactate dehydrogenase complex protein LldG
VNVESVVRTVIDIARKKNAATIVGWHFSLIDDRRLTEALQAANIRLITAIAGNEGEQFRAAAAQAALGLTGVDYAVADTGSLVLLSGDEKPRCASLLPPVHIAVVKGEQILAGLPELFERLDSNEGRSSSAATLITGPSRTADIELTLVVGVHGPQELHVIIETQSISG